MLGGNETSYGARPPKGKTWKQIFIDEVRAKNFGSGLEAGSLPRPRAL